MKKLALFLTLAGATMAVGCSSRSYYSGPPRDYVYRSAPAPGYVWVDPYRDWRYNRWERVPGAWVRPPRPGTRWHPGYFRHHNRQRVWVSPYWR